MAQRLQRFNDVQVYQDDTSGNTPESRLWGAFLIYLVRDVVPEYVTDYRGRSHVTRMSKKELDQTTSTYIFEMACEINNFNPSYFRKRLEQIRTIEPSEIQIWQHNKKYPNGGRSSLLSTFLLRGSA